jgi:sugar phosphate permease
MDRMRKAAEWGSWAEDYVSERWGWKGGVVVTVVALAVLALIFYPLWSTW